MYTINAITTLPTFGEELGKGGNGRVFKCYITTPDKNKLQFACKVEKKVYVPYQVANLLYSSFAAATVSEEKEGRV